MPDPRTEVDNDQTLDSSRKSSPESISTGQTGVVSLPLVLEIEICVDLVKKRCPSRCSFGYHSNFSKPQKNIPISFPELSKVEICVPKAKFPLSQAGK